MILRFFSLVMRLDIVVTEALSLVALEISVHLNGRRKYYALVSYNYDTEEYKLIRDERPRRPCEDACHQREWQAIEDGTGDPFTRGAKPTSWDEVRCRFCGAKVEVPQRKRLYLNPDQIEGSLWCSCKESSYGRAEHYAKEG